MSTMNQDSYKTRTTPDKASQGGQQNQGNTPGQGAQQNQEQRNTGGAQQGGNKSKTDRKES